MAVWQEGGVLGAINALVELAIGVVGALFAVVGILAAIFLLIWLGGWLFGEKKEDRSLIQASAIYGEEDLRRRQATNRRDALLSQIRAVQGREEVNQKTLEDLVILARKVDVEYRDAWPDIPLHAPLEDMVLKVIWERLEQKRKESSQ